MLPKICPSCHGELVKDGVQVFCVSSECTEKNISRLVYFASKKCMNIEGLSEKIIGLLYETNKVRRFSDFYKLKKEDFEGLEGFQDKKINNVLTSIKKSKDTTLSNFINGLSIEGVGEKTSKDIVKRFKSLDKVMVATYDELVQIRDIGEVTAKNIVNYFLNEENKLEITSLLNLGVKIQEVEEKDLDTNNFFYNKKFVLTGTLNDYTREEASKLIEDRGGVTSNSVSKKTDYVLFGSDAGSKLDKARELNVKTIDEEEFKKHLSEN